MPSDGGNGCQGACCAGVLSAGLIVVIVALVMLVRWVI